MIRRIKPMAYASILGLAAVHCGGGSTPPSNTPGDVSNYNSSGATGSDSSSAAMGSSTRSGGDSSTSGMSSAGDDMSSSGSRASSDSTAAGSNDRMPVAGKDEADMGSNASGATNSTTLSDAQIAAITDHVNDGEIQEAQLALSKSKNAQVLSFARMMIQHHGDAKKKQASLGLGTAPSPLSRTISSKGQDVMSMLQPKTGEDFDRAYLQAQIDQHQEVLNHIDRELLPNATNMQLRAQLQSLRPTVQQHLSAARDAMKSLDGNGQGQQGSSSSQTRDSKTKSSGQRTGTGRATEP